MVMELVVSFVLHSSVPVTPFAVNNELPQYYHTIFYELQELIKRAAIGSVLLVPSICVVGLFILHLT